MRNKILEFKNLLRKNKENREHNESISNPIAHKDTWTFQVTSHLCSFGTGHLSLIDLDEEDIKYFTDKYLSKEDLDKEMENEINELKAKYK